MPREPLVFGQPRSPTSSSNALTSTATRLEVGPGDARRGIEIDAELVRMIEIADAHGMGMQFDAAEVHDEGQARRIVDHQFLRRASGGKGKRHGSEPLRPRGGRPFMVE